MPQIHLKDYLPTYHRKTTVVIWFDSRDTLENAMDSVLLHNQGDLLDIGHAALISRGPDNEAIILNNNVTPAEGVIAGIMLGASMLALGVIQLGALDLPGGATALALGLGILAGGLMGGCIGYAVAKFTGFGFAPALLTQTAQQAADDRVALMFHAHRTQIPTLHDVLAEFEVQIEEVCVNDKQQ